MTQFIITEDFPKTQAEFDERFSDESACYEYLMEFRWSQGFRCVRCDNHDFWPSSRGLLICTRCEHQHSLTAGTIMHGTRKPLTDWFKAMWWFTTRKSGVNAINLKDLLGLGSYGTAWTWLHKLRTCTVRKDREKLEGQVEVDEFYIGGRHGGKRGRGSGHKCPVAAAVEKQGRKLGRIRLQAIDDCSSEALIPFINLNVEKKSNVTTDGWSSYLPVKGQGDYDHERVIQADAEDKSSVLPGVHIVASLVKRLILGTFQGRFDKKHLQRYLDEYVFRFNRRNSKSIGKKFMRIVQQAVVTAPVSYSQIVKVATANLLTAN